jgi:hypothetical protein
MDEAADTAGDDSPMPKSADVARYFHRFAGRRSIARSSPVPAPTYTTPSAMTAEDSMAPPAS